MSNVVIKVENLSKQYRLGSVGTGSFAHDLNRAWHKVRGKEDPYLTVGETNDRSVIGNSEYVWALQNINFDIHQGEVVGIIGSNGAGKSTLLKILSRTTSPTSGNVKLKGRVASLLEVGTGFHPELSGRENIFLNGAILGMSKREIRSKFDEIVNFSGVERYIDTPVKRYSSGMYVRLAFAVAAHLDPEILIVDEVLAVGDAEFQKKALGKMKDVSNKEGRTVLFVSHNIPAVKKLCDRGIILKNGSIIYDGQNNIAIDKYMEDINSPNQSHFINESVKVDSDILEIKIVNNKNELCSVFDFDESVRIFFSVKIAEKHLNATLGFRAKDQFDRNIFSSEIKLSDHLHNEGNFVFSVDIPHSILSPNVYQVVVAIHIINKEIISLVESSIGFEIAKSKTAFTEYPDGIDYGCVHINCNWAGK